MGSSGTWPGATRPAPATPCLGHTGTLAPKSICKKALSTIQSNDTLVTCTGNTVCFVWIELHFHTLQLTPDCNNAFVKVRQIQVQLIAMLYPFLQNQRWYVPSQNCVHPTNLTWPNLGHNFEILYGLKLFITWQVMNLELCAWTCIKDRANFSWY